MFKELESSCLVFVSLKRLMFVTPIYHKIDKRQNSLSA